MKPIAVLTTIGSLDEARAIASALVHRKLAACAQISEIESCYAWKGAVHHEKEFRILFKTTDARYEAVQAAINELHSYELPAIWAVEFQSAYAPYAKWIDENSTGQPP